MSDCAGTGKLWIYQSIVILGCIWYVSIKIYIVENCFNIYIVKTVIGKTILIYSWTRRSCNEGLAELLGTKN